LIVGTEVFPTIMADYKHEANISHKMQLLLYMNEKDIPVIRSTLKKFTKEQSSGAPSIFVVVDGDGSNGPPIIAMPGTVSTSS